MLNITSGLVKLEGFAWQVVFLKWLRYIINVFTPLNFLGTIYNMVGGFNAADFDLSDGCCIESGEIDKQLVKLDRAGSERM